MLARTWLAAALLSPMALVAQGLPKAETILDRHIEASGGKAVYAAKKTTLMKGTMELAPMGLKGALTLYRAEPGLMLTEVVFEGLGRMLEGFDGKVAWAYSAMQGPQVKTGEERDTVEQGARFHAENWREEFKQVQTLGLETLEGEPCYKVLATPHKGQPSTQFYSVKTGLLVKAQGKLKTAMGDMEVESATRDYRSAGGILVPHLLVQSVAGQTITLKFESVEWNVQIPKDKFDAPAEVKALLEAPKPAAK